MSALDRFEMFQELLFQKLTIIFHQESKEQKKPEEINPDFNRLYEYSNPIIYDEGSFKIKPQTVFLPKHRIIMKQEKEMIKKFSENKFIMKLKRQVGIKDEK